MKQSFETSDREGLWFDLEAAATTYNAQEEVAA
jgi:hypothetical protein